MPLVPHCLRRYQFAPMLLSSFIIGRRPPGCQLARLGAGLSREACVNARRPLELQERLENKRCLAALGRSLAMSPIDLKSAILYGIA